MTTTASPSAQIRVHLRRLPLLCFLLSILSILPARAQSWRRGDLDPKTQVVDVVIVKVVSPQTFDLKTVTLPEVEFRVTVPVRPSGVHPGLANAIREALTGQLATLTIPWQQGGHGLQAGKKIEINPDQLKVAGQTYYLPFVAK